MNRLTAIAAILWILIVSAGGVAQDQPSLGTGIQDQNEYVQYLRSRPKYEAFKMADFYLQDGTFVSGRIIEDDRSKMTLEVRDGSRLRLVTCHRKEIETRSLKISRMPAHQYYIELAQYYLARTWDFRNDPDDFIQAIRAYDMAKSYLQQLDQPPADKLAEIEQALAEVRRQRKLWLDEVSQRAEQKSLEFEAEIQNRLETLETTVSTTLTEMQQTVRALNETVRQNQVNYDTVLSALEQMEERVNDQIKTLNQKIERNRELINNSAVQRIYPYPYYYRRSY